MDEENGTVEKEMTASEAPTGSKLHSKIQTELEAGAERRRAEEEAKRKAQKSPVITRHGPFILEEGISGPQRLKIEEDDGSITEGPLMPGMTEQIKAYMDANTNLLQSIAPYHWQKILAQAWRYTMMIYALNDPALVGTPESPLDPKKIDTVPEGVKDKVRIALVGWEERIDPKAIPQDEEEAFRQGFGGLPDGSILYSPSVELIADDPEWRKKALPAPIPPDWQVDYPHGVRFMSATLLDPHAFRADDPPKTFKFWAIVAYILGTDAPWLVSEKLSSPVTGIQKQTEGKQGRRNALAPLKSVINYPSDPIFKGTIESFMHAPAWESREGFHRAYSVKTSDHIQETIGFRVDPGLEMWEFLCARGEAAIKAHFALWGRFYQETGGEVNRTITMSIPQFCRDLGYTPSAKGFKRERKLEAMRLLETLTTVEMSVVFSSGKGKPARRIRGPIWRRGLIAENCDQYEDLWGSAREGDKNFWEPVGFSYGPGEWFADPVWRQYYKTVGLVGMGLLKLDSNNDKWAIRIGGYIVTLARIGQYKRRCLVIANLLKRTGLWDRNKGRRGEQEACFRRAMDRLVEVGVLQSWTLRTSETKVSDPDTEEDEATDEVLVLPKNDWRKLRIVITWPPELSKRTQVIEARQQAAIEKATIAKAQRTAGKEENRHLN